MEIMATLKGEPEYKVDQEASSRDLIQIHAIPKDPDLKTLGNSQRDRVACLAIPVLLGHTDRRTVLLWCTHHSWSLLKS